MMYICVTRTSYYWNLSVTTLTKEEGRNATMLYHSLSLQFGERSCAYREEEDVDGAIAHELTQMPLIPKQYIIVQLVHLFKKWKSTSSNYNEKARNQGWASWPIAIPTPQDDTIKCIIELYDTKTIYTVQTHSLVKKWKSANSKCNYKAISQAWAYWPITTPHSYKGVSSHLVGMIEQGAPHQRNRGGERPL